MLSLPNRVLSTRPSRRANHRPTQRRALALAAAALLCAAGPSQAATNLADQPLFAASDAPGNLALLLSVEFPTAVSVAHTNRSYSAGSEYLGFFDPKKCYSYRYSDGTGTDNYFYPVGTATGHRCTNRWSGNFLNWSSMQTIDPFRWVLTGGYRVVDTASLTVVEKAWATGQGGAANFPDSTIGSADIAGATPFAASAGTLYMRIQGLGNKMRFTLPDTSAGISFKGDYYNNKTLSGGAVLSRTDASIDFPNNAPTGPGFNGTDISVRWTGKVTAPTAGSYNFRAGADDGVRLWVDGTLVIDRWIDQGTTYYDSGPINGVAAGHQFDIKLEYYQGGGGAAVQLLWQRPGDGGFSVIGAPVASLYADASHYNPAGASTSGTVYEVFMRAKVCDSDVAAGGVETNCVAYGTNWKPEGLIQKYANKIRYSAFGYLNDSNILRDGAILRAKQKFVGPTQPVPGSTPIANAAPEWNPSTGVFVRNPNSADASATNALFGTSVQDSGVMNYLNKFGEITPGEYKTYDNVGELYYAAVRYFKNQGNVPQWSDMSGAGSSTRRTWADGFPVVTDWDDPILYSCQRNFILGIGDANTHADKNVPGNTSSNNEPPMPALVVADTTVNAVTATNKLGVLEGLGATLGLQENYNGCCSNNATLMAGLAYDSHTKDIRPRDFLVAGQTRDPITLDTYWVDVQEYQTYKSNNQFYLATKYGGFKVPRGYDFENNTTPLPLASWHSNTDINNGQPRPDNYFSGGRPDLVLAGLNSAFADIASKIKSYTTSFSTSLPQVAVAGNSSFSSQFDASDWKGEVKASELRFDANGEPSLIDKWTFSSLLTAQLAGTGWNSNRLVATWNPDTRTGVAFRSAALAASQRSALDPTFTAASDADPLLDYLRGDRTNEVGSSVVGSSQAYRSRSALIGDIVGSKARPIGPPSFPYSDVSNPGYSAFKSTWANRPTVVYVGANDGMLHAINGSLSGAGGTEMFAYVPGALYDGPNGTPSVDGLASLANPTFTHHYLVNATPNVYDVDFGRTPDSSGNARAGSPDWRSILIGGLGKGGRSYYAIDVTDPAGMASGGEGTVASKVLWEFTDTDLGYTYGDPVVVKTRKYGWVVILPSGYNTRDGESHLLFVNPRTGGLLEKVATGAGSLASESGLGHINAFVVNAADGTADSVYGGDLLGNLWRVDLTTAAGSAYPAAQKIAVLSDAIGVGQPVTSRPSIEVHYTTKKRFVLVGTGRLLSTSDIASTQSQAFYAIVDGNNARFNSAADLPAGITFPIVTGRLAENTVPLGGGAPWDPATQMGWFEQLGSGAGGIGWRVTSDSATLLGSVAFAATLPNGSVCNPSGSSHIYARDFATAGSTVQSSGPGSIVPAVYVTMSGTVTDLRYLSVNGKGTLISGTDVGTVNKINISAIPNLALRRLNWRELQVVE